MRILEERYGMDVSVYLSRINKRNCGCIRKPTGIFESVEPSYTIFFDKLGF